MVCKIDKVNILVLVRVMVAAVRNKSQNFNGSTTEEFDVSWTFRASRQSFKPKVFIYKMRVVKNIYLLN